MSRVPVLKGLRVDCGLAAVRISFAWARASTPQVRVLRSTRCSCESPDAHLADDSGQTLAHEGRQLSFVDQRAPQDEDLFYTIFARRGSRAPWRRPISLRVHRCGYQPPALGLPPAGPSVAAEERYAQATLAGKRFVEIEGETEAAPVIAGPRDLAGLAITVATIPVLACFLVGVSPRLITAVALALAITWRLTEGEQPDLRRFLTYLAVPASAALLVFLAGSLFLFFASALLTAVVIRPAHVLSYLYPILLVAAMAAVWVISGRLARDSESRRWWWGLLAGLVALGALVPIVGCAMAIVVGGLEYRSVAREWNRQAQEREAELRAQSAAAAARSVSLVSRYADDEEH
jgi:hypothetical protein